ncbi:MAG: choice-of-anchor B family protein [Saprospiraceae bacterium]
MYKFLFVIPVVLLLSTGLYGQKKSFNTKVLSEVGFGSENSNDIWGYVDDTGVQYAVIGNARNTRVFSLENPKSPILRHTAPGAQSVWRDIKSYNKHLYVTTDQGTDGLVIIDMTKAPDTISHIFFQPLLTVGTATKNLERCHNIYIDEKGFAYLSGCNISNRGVLIFDLKQDPNAPVYVGSADVNYSHDNFARGDTLYSSEINVGKLGIYDITDRSNPVLMASRTTSRTFTHNAWVSDDNRYVFTTDERPNAYVDAYDVSDLNNIRLIDQFRPLDTEGDGVIPHNTHYFEGYIVTSWYTDGLRIVDAHKPDNLIEVAYYDTWEDNSTCHSGFSGCWGAFPFTDNNLVYASDINNGLYILEVDYKRAAYLEGKVTNLNGNTLEGVKIYIHSDQTNREFTNAAGLYKTGHALYGNFVVEATHPDYAPASANLEFIAGEVTEWNIVMEKPRTFDTEFIIKNEDNNPIPAFIELRNKITTIPITIDESGHSTAQILSTEYDILITSWGYVPKVLEGYKIENAGSLEITLERGIVDFFETDLGWEILSSSNNMSGVWERAVPRATFTADNIASNPGIDDETDYGSFAFVTQNGLPGAACADVDNGTTTLISPTFDLLGYTNPELSFSYWFFTAGGASPFDDSLKVYITNGETEALLMVNGTNTNGWDRLEKIKLNDFLVLTDDMRLIIEVSDLSPTGHIVEAAFDNVSIINGTSSTNNQELAQILSIRPNPASDIIHIENYIANSPSLICLNAMGQWVNLPSLGSGYYDVSRLSKGFYMVKIGNFSGKFIKGN